MSLHMVEMREGLEYPTGSLAWFAVNLKLVRDAHPNAVYSASVNVATARLVWEGAAALGAVSWDDAASWERMKERGIMLLGVYLQVFPRGRNLMFANVAEGAE